MYQNILNRKPTVLVMFKTIFKIFIFQNFLSGLLVLSSDMGDPILPLKYTSLSEFLKYIKNKTQILCFILFNENENEKNNPTLQY